MALDPPDIDSPLDVTILHPDGEAKWSRWLHAQAAGLGLHPRAASLDLRAGANRVRFIDEALAAPRVLAVLTPGALADPHFGAALDAAIDAHHRRRLTLIPVLVEARDDRSALLGAIEPLSFVSTREAEARRRLAVALGFPPERVDADYPGEVEWPGNPFPGLAPFDFEQAALFGGRDADVAAALDLLRQAPWLRIEGGSGYGKSSLARAGVLPALAAGEGGFAAHDHAVIRPAGTPLRALAAALAGPEQAAIDALHARLLDGDPAALAWWLAERPAPRRPLALLVDQFEEALRPPKAPPEIARLDALLAAALTAPEGLLRLVTTTRSDQSHRLDRLPALAALQLRHSRQHLLLPMDRAALRAALDRPLAHHGLDWPDSALPARIVADALDPHGHSAPDEPARIDAGAVLPLVAHAACALWSGDPARAGDTPADGPRLTLAAYHAMGGVAGALAAGADACYRALDAAHRPIADRLLLRLVRPGRGAADARAPVERADLLADVGEAEGEAVLLHLSGGGGMRLLTVGRLGGAAARVELIHEALLTAWPHLRDLIERHRRALERRADREAAAAEWAARGRPRAWLPNAARLDWLRGDGLGPEERATLDAGRSAEVRDFLAAATAEVARSRRRARLVTAAFAALALLAAGVAAVAVHQWRGAERARGQAEAAIGNALEVAELIQRTAEGDLPRLAGSAPVQRKLLDETARLLDALLAVEVEGRALDRSRMLTHKLRCEVALGREALNRARRECEKALHLARKLAQSDTTRGQRDLARILVAQGAVDLRAGDVTRARVLVEESLGIQRLLLASHSASREIERELSVSLDLVGEVHLLSSDLTRARAAFVESLKIARALSNAKPESKIRRRDISVSLEYLGRVELRAGNTSQARTYFEESLDIRRTLSSTDPDPLFRHDILISLEKLGELELDAGNLIKARAFFQESLDIARALADADPDAGWLRDDIAASLRNLGEVEQRAGDLARARIFFQESLDIRRTLSTADPNDAERRRGLSICLTSLGLLEKEAGDLARARHLLQESLDIREALAASYPGSQQFRHDTASAFINLGGAEQLAGDLAKARALFDESLRMSRALSTASPGDLDFLGTQWSSLVNLAGVEQRAGDIAQERTLLQESVQVARALYVAEPSERFRRNLAISLRRMGYVEQRAGDYTKARSSILESVEIARALSLANPLDARLRRDISVGLTALGDLEEVAGNLVEARAHIQESLDIDRSLSAAEPANVQLRDDLAVSHAHMAKLALRVNDLREAQRHIAAAVALRAALIAQDPTRAEFRLRAVTTRATQLHIASLQHDSAVMRAAWVAADADLALLEHTDTFAGDPYVTELRQYVNRFRSSTRPPPPEPAP